MTALPRLHQNSQTVTLSFEGTLIQSCMSLADPDDLVLDYTRTMMGALVLNPSPGRILLVGLGGGSMVKYLHRHVPDAHLTVVEISQAVIDLRETFQVPPDDERLRTVCDDGARFVAHPPSTYDLILVDGFTGTGIADALCTRSFYKHCRQALSTDGLLVANVQADTEQTQQISQRLSKAFGGSIMSVLSDEGGNDIITAGERHLFERCRADFEGHWARLAPVHQTTLAVASTRIERALSKGFARPSLAVKTTRRTR